MIGDKAGGTLSESCVAELQCLICHKILRKAGSHFTQYHHLTPQEYYDRFVKSPGEGVCQVCGLSTRFVNVRQGYATTCSRVCNAKNPDRVKKARETLERNYGVSFPLQSEEIRRKVKDTNLSRYGSENPAQNPEIRDRARKTSRDTYGVDVPSQSPLVQEKTRDTNRERYGVDWVSQNREIRKKQERTNCQKYGNSVPSTTDKVKEKTRATNRARYGADSFTQTQAFKECMSRKAQETVETFEHEHDVVHLSKVIQEYGQGWYKALDVPLVFHNSNAYVPRELLKDVEKYRKETGRSVFEREVHAFVERVYDGEVIVNSRSVIPPRELDIVVPDKNVAIECNGDFWHSEMAGKDRNYHLNKTIATEAQGMRLIHIGEWEWYSKKDICQSIVSSALGIVDTVIYARKCDVGTVSTQEARAFLEANHLQGFVGAEWCLGLFYEGELVQMISIGRSRFTQGEHELLRMATRLYTRVVGGFSRLLSHTPERFFPLVSYVDRSKFTGASYRANGFIVEGFSEPGYSYVRQGERVSRYQAHKSKLPSLLGDNFNPELSETDNMIRNGFVKIYDCGTMKVRK